nr:hypothetical protein Iba_chr02dCG9830 [Ipomoea batatas]
MTFRRYVRYVHRENPFIRPIDFQLKLTKIGPEKIKKPRVERKCPIHSTAVIGYGPRGSVNTLRSRPVQSLKSGVVVDVIIIVSRHPFYWVVINSGAFSSYIIPCGNRNNFDSINKRIRAGRRSEGYVEHLAFVDVNDILFVDHRVNAGGEIGAEVSQQEVEADELGAGGDGEGVGEVGLEDSDAGGVRDLGDVRALPFGLGNQRFEEEEIGRVVSWGFCNYAGGDVGEEKEEGENGKHGGFLWAMELGWVFGSDEGAFVAAKGVRWTRGFIQEKKSKP